MIGCDYKSYVAVGEHKIIMPACPTKKEDVLFVDERPENAFWRRDTLIKDYREIWFDFLPHITKAYQGATLYDQDGILVSLNKEDSDYIVRIYEQEIKRRRQGVYIRNKNTLTWLTGDHYNALMWCKGQRHDGMGDYFDYREFQAWFFYLIHHCWAYPHILGLFMSKAKKTGITNMFWLYYLNRATMSKNKNYGFMSLDQSIAAKTMRDYFLYSYNNMVPALRPQYKNKSENDGTIIFGKSYNNSKKAKLAAYDSADELNSSVLCVPTKDKAFDVAVMNDIAFDEPTKYKQSFGSIFRTNKEAVKIQSKINGRAFLFNYTSGEDTGSFKESREIFFESELKTITTNSQGQTNSGLICYHLPAFVSWEGCFDKYGICDEKRALQENQRERDKDKGNKRNLQTTIRQYANDKREAWNPSGAGSTFDNIRLGDLVANLTEDHLAATDNPYIEGRYDWTNPLWEIGLRNRRKPGEFCPVKFIPLTEDERAKGVVGKCRSFKTIALIDRNKWITRGKDEYGCVIPPERFDTVGGVDPTNYAASTEVIQGSKNAAYFMSMPDEKLDARVGAVASKIIVTEYYDRAELPIESYEDILKQILYHDALVIVEANASFVATKLMEEGLGHFMLVKDENGIITRWKPWMGLAGDPDKKYSLIRMTSNAAQSKDMLESLVRVIKSYIQEPNQGEKDYGATIKTEELLNGLMNFDPTDTKLFDRPMAWGWTLLCLELYIDMLINSNDDGNPEEYFFALDALSSDFD